MINVKVGVMQSQRLKEQLPSFLVDRNARMVPDPKQPKATDVVLVLRFQVWDRVRGVRSVSATAPAVQVNLTRSIEAKAPGLGMGINSGVVDFESALDVFTKARPLQLTCHVNGMVVGLRYQRNACSFSAFVHFTGVDLLGVFLEDKQFVQEGRLLFKGFDLVLRNLERKERKRQKITTQVILCHCPRGGCTSVSSSQTYHRRRRGRFFFGKTQYDRAYIAKKQATRTDIKSSLMTFSLCEKDELQLD